MEAVREEAGRPSVDPSGLSALKRAFNLALRAGRLEVKPHIPSIEVQNVRTGFFEVAELKAVLAELPEEIRPIIRLCFLTGWRIGETLTLPWRQVDFKAGIVRLEPGTTKNDEGRTFPFSALPELAELLLEQRERTTVCEHETGAIIPWIPRPHPMDAVSPPPALERCRSRDIRQTSGAPPVPRPHRCAGR